MATKKNGKNNSCPLTSLQLDAKTAITCNDSDSDRIVLGCIENFRPLRSFVRRKKTLLYSKTA